MSLLTPDEAAASHADLVRVPSIIFFAVTPIFVVIRFWNRISRRSGLGWDDGTILVSFWFYVAQIFYKLTINLTKMSIVLLYLRIFVQKWFRISCYILLGIVTAYAIASTSMSIWQCNPIRGAWDKSVNPTCISLTKNWYANAGYSIATDVLILALPMQPIWASKLPINQKRALMFVFALGSFSSVTVTSILRATTLNFSTTSPDTTFDITSTLWTIIEENVAIICACLPMCRIVLAFIFPKIFGGNTTKGSTGASGLSGGMGSESQNKYGYARSTSPSRRQSWKPYSGPGGDGISRSTAAHQSDDTSEEFILTSVQRHGSTDDQDGAIRKTTKYEISYESESYKN
ncbi:integral membrane [Trichoderma arundinaceum]|uniref:Integral membrane n=1 Tax=Trichoderma arundinaceum TaxID=490622 RepID=A0A395N724_TRIAR|nr:integral membrane [Trichoderma arundinaceum]